MKSSPVAASQPKTRDQVEREVLQAQREGYFDRMRGEATYAPEFQKATTSSLSRDEVQLAAESLAASIALRAALPCFVS